MSILSALLHRPRPAVTLPPSRALARQWHYRPPEPVPPPPPRRVPIPGTDKVQLEERQDCLKCGGARDSVVRANGYQCLTCKTLIFTA